MDEFVYEELITRFLAGELAEPEVGQLREWLEKDPVNRRLFDKENELWQFYKIYSKDYFNTNRAWNELVKKLNLKGSNGKHFIFLRKTNFILFIAAASVAAVFAVSGFALFLSGRQMNTDRTSQTTAILTGDGERSQIFFSDSSHVILNSGSILEYASDFNYRTREVRLSGEGFFDVQKIPRKPFIVNLKRMSVIALGTRFNISSYENEDHVEATLEEGMIRVAIQGYDTIEVRNGQQVVYDIKKGKPILRDVSTETYTSWKENKLRFMDTPMEDVLRKIGRRYNVVFEIRNRDLMDLKYTATFIDESVEEIMQMLQEVSPIKYTIQNRTTIYDKHYLKPKIILEHKNRN